MTNLNKLYINIKEMYKDNQLYTCLKWLINHQTVNKMFDSY